MNGLLQKIMSQMMNGALNNNPMMGLFQQMMSGKSKEQQIQTLLNSAKSQGLDVNEKCFSEQDLRQLGLKK